VPARSMAQTQGGDRARDRGTRHRPPRIRRTLAHAADQRGFHRRARADPPGAEGARSDPPPHQGYPRGVGPTQEADRRDQAAGSLTMRVLGKFAAVCAAGATLAGCDPVGDMGYVEIKTVPVSAVSSPSLYLDTVKLDPLKKGVAVLRQRVGTARLAT